MQQHVVGEVKMFQCQVSSWCCISKIINTGCCISRSNSQNKRWMFYEKHGTKVELLHANYLASAYYLFCIFAEEFSTDVSSLDDILLLSSKLYDIVLMWTNRRWRGNSTWQQQVLPKFLYISGPAEPLESHRFSGEEKTRLQSYVHQNRRALIFSGNVRPIHVTIRSAYPVHSTPLKSSPSLKLTLLQLSQIEALTDFYPDAPRG